MIKNIQHSLFVAVVATILIAIASINNTAQAYAALPLELHISPIGEINDSLRAITYHLDSRIVDLAETDSALNFRMMLPVVSTSLRPVMDRLEQHDPFAPISIGLDPSQLDVRVEQQQRYIDLIVRSIDRRRQLLDHLPTLTPVSGRFTSGFGSRVHPISGRVKNHEGVDLATRSGTPIHVSGAGVVVFAGVRNGYGNVIEVEHEYGYRTLYAHCSRLVSKEGDTVSRGQVIALVGSTGASTGAHLHYEVSVDDEKVDPSGFLLDAPIAEQQVVTAPAKAKKKSRSTSKRRRK